MYWTKHGSLLGDGSESSTGTVPALHPTLRACGSFFSSPDEGLAVNRKEGHKKSDKDPLTDDR